MTTRAILAGEYVPHVRPAQPVEPSVVTEVAA